MTETNRKQLIFDTFDNKETERVPVGFGFTLFSVMLNFVVWRTERFWIE